jgi:hypothetical protein
MSRRRPGNSDSTDASAYSRRAAIADSAWSAQDRLRSGSGEALKATGEVVRSPFERVSYSLRKQLLWPLQDRAATLGRPARALSTAAVVLVAVGAGVAGLVWAAPDKSEAPTSARVVETSAPIAAAAATPAQPAEPTLQGATPVFETGKAKASAAEVDPAQAILKSSAEPDTGADAAATATAPLAATSSSASAGASKSKSQLDGPPAGPAAISVANDFADAFLLYETGGTDGAVRRAFGATATSALAKALLKRPPRLPANVKVPNAKVLNVVAAPSHGGVYPVSVSLLRVGVTSELRLDMEKLKGDRWRVTNVLG